MTQGGADALPLEEEHCSVVEVTEEDIQNSVKFVPSLSAVVRNPDRPPVIDQFDLFRLFIGRKGDARKTRCS